MHRDFALRQVPPVLYRVGWASNPVAFRPWSTITPETFAGRFDDPSGEYRTFYAAGTAEAALREKILSYFRPDPKAFARLDALDELSHDEKKDMAAMRAVPQSLLTDFVLTTLEVVEPCYVVDVTHSDSLDAYFDRTDRRVSVDDVLDSTCTIASRRMGHKIWQQNHPGVVYPSRHGTNLVNFALFETGHQTDQLSVTVRQLEIQLLDANCEVLLKVAEDLNLKLEFPAPAPDTRALWVHMLLDALRRLGNVDYYERTKERGLRYYSMRVPGMKVTVVTFPSNNVVEVDAITPEGSAHTTASTAAAIRDVLIALSTQDKSVARAIESAIV